MVSTFGEYQLLVFNLNNNELVNHSYLLIKGMIRHTTKFHLNPDLVIYLDNHHLTPDDCIITNVTSDNPRFKCLINLEANCMKAKTGKRVLRFEYASLHLDLTIFYEPKCTPCKVQPLLIIAKDEEGSGAQIDRNLRIIQLNLLLVQCVYAEKMREANKGRCTFELIRECRILQMPLTRQQICLMNENDLWQSVVDELSLSHDNYNEINQTYLKYVGFINCSHYECISEEDNENSGT